MPTRYEIFKKNCKEFREKWEEAQKVSETLRDIKTVQELQHLPPKSQSMVKLLAYLGLVESLGVTLSDMVLILLIANEKEVHTRWPIAKHAATTSELEEINLAYKLDFLKAEGFGLFKKFINRKLRNKIAHLEFRILDNGEIRKKDKKQTRIDIDKEISKFWSGVDTLKLVFEDIGYSKEFAIEKGV